jgi:hypothetical protein
MKTFLMFVLFGFLAFSSAAQNTDTLKVDKTPITSSEFNRLLQSVKNQDSDSLKVEILRETFINTNYFNTSQIRKLLSLIPKDSDKLALARSAYDRVTDQDNFVQLADLFQSSIYKTEFINWTNKPDK